MSDFGRGYNSSNKLINVGFSGWGSPLKLDMFRQKDIKTEDLCRSDPLPPSGYSPYCSISLRNKGRAG